jgi:hypothetical protein
MPDIDIAKLDHERSFSEEEGDIITEIVRSTCDSHTIFILCSSLPGYSATISKATNADTPSKSAKSTGYRMKQVRLPRPISCHEFCERYSILAADEAKLDKLDFLPGDREIKRLGREDRNGEAEAEFSRLAWQHVLTKHREFLTDVENGSWNLNMDSS